MSNELKNHYGENTSYLCYEGHLALHDFYDEDNAGYVIADFDIECEGGCANVDTIALLESAHVVIEEQSTELEQLRKERDDLKEAVEAAMRIKDLWLPVCHFADNPPQYYRELEALSIMANNFEQALTKLNKQSGE